MDACSMWLRAKADDGISEVTGGEKMDAVGVNPNVKDRMTELKQRIARREYEVDSARVAEEMLRRLRLARWARVALTDDAGRDPGRVAPAR